MSSLTPVPFSRRKESQPRLSKPYVPGKRHERFWTDEEKQVLVDHYAKDGAAACALKIPGRSVHRIYAQAHKMGLVSAKVKRPSTHRTKADVAALDTQIREAWPELQGRGPVTAFAQQVGAQRWFVSKRARALGLTMPHKKEPPWTAAENELMAKIRLDNCDRAADIFRQHGFKRSPTAIMVRAKRLSLSRRRTDVFSATSAAALLGVDSKTVHVWLINGELKGEKRGTKRLVQQGGDTWSITPADLRQFIIEKLERIDLRKVDKFAFVGLLTAPGEATIG